MAVTERVAAFFLHYSLKNMRLETIHTYLVYPEKNVEEQSEVRGMDYTRRTGKLFTLLESIFTKSPTECKNEIQFEMNDRGEQQNDCQDIVLKYLAKRSLVNGGQLAERLQRVSTHRSGLGLLFLLYGASGANKRLVISRFPADSGILAEEGNGKLEISFVEKIFMKSSKAYKAVVYEGSSKSDFWEGKAIDKQINNPETEISEYWIRDFLASDFLVTADRGTKRLAVAIKKVIKKSTDVEVKQEIASAVKLAKNLNGRVVNVNSFLDKLNVSEEVKKAVQTEMSAVSVAEKFRFSSGTFYEFLPYRSIELDNGAIVTGPADTFDEVFEVRVHRGNKTSYYTIGTIVNEKFKQRG